MTIRVKTLLITFGFMLMILTVFGWVQHQSVSDKLDDQMREKIQAYVSQKACEINKVLDEHASQLDLLANFVEQEGPNGNSGIEPWMRTLAARERVQAVSVVYYDEYGKAIKWKSFGDIYEGRIPNGADLFLQGAEERVKPGSKGQWFTSVLTANQSKLTLQYVRKIEFPGSGKVLVGLALKTESFEKVVKEMRISNRDYGVLLDNHMNFIYHPTFKQGTNLRAAYNGQFNSVADDILRAPQKGSASYPWFDQRVKTFFYQGLSNQWVVGLTVFKEDITVAPATSKVVTAGFMLAFIGAGLLSLLLATVLTRPMRELSLVLQDMGLGHYDHAVSQKHIRRKDEMGTMAGAIEKLRCLQQEHLQGLRQYQELIEDKVLEKMDALSKANEELELSLTIMEDKNQELQGIESRHFEVLEKLQTAQQRLQQAEQVMTAGLLTHSALQAFEQEKDNVLSLTAYLKSEIDQMAPKLAVLEGHDHKELEEQLLQNLLDGADLITKSMMNLEPLLNQLTWPEDWKDLQIETFNVRKVLLDTADAFGLLEQEAEGELLILCDSGETMIGNVDAFKKIVKLMIEDRRSERLKSERRGHIYIKYESKGDTKKMTVSGDRKASTSENLYIKAAETLLKENFSGKLTSEPGRGDGQIYHLIFKG